MKRKDLWKYILLEVFGRYGWKEIIESLKERKKAKVDMEREKYLASFWASNLEVLKRPISFKYLGIIQKTKCLCVKKM